MIAATRRMAMHDFLLVAFSVVVIVLSVVVQPAKHRTIEVRNASGQLERYLLAADDPRIAKLEGKLANWVKAAQDTRLTLANWRFELAEFYIGRTKSRPENRAVVQVAFTDKKLPSTNQEAAALVAQHEYWTRVRDQARQVIDSAEDRLRERHSSTPPIVLGEEVTSTRPAPSAFGLAGLTGLVVATCFACWVYACPAISLGQDSQCSPAEIGRSDHEGRLREIRLSIPPQWVRVHQPLAVVLRRFVYSALVLGAFACLMVCS